MMVRAPQITREEFRSRMMKDTGIDPEAWIVLLSKDKHAIGETVVSAELHAEIQRLRQIATIKTVVAEAKDLKLFQVSAQQRAQWAMGHAVLVKFAVIEQVEPRPAAGQPESGTEWHVKNVLATTVFLASEYVAQLEALQSRNVQFSKEALRDKAFVSLADAWPNLIFARGLLPPSSEAETEARLRHLSALHSRGRRDNAWGKLFSEGTRPRDLVRHDHDRLRALTREDQKKEIWFWQQCVRSLLVCQAAAKRRRQAIAETSDTIEQRGEEFPGQREDMVHGLQARPHVADILPAVHAGMEPRVALELNLHLQTLSSEFDTVAALGSLSRGVAVTLSAPLVNGLQGVMQDLAEPGDRLSEQQANRLTFLRHAMLGIWGQEVWTDIFSRASKDPSAEFILPSPRAVRA